MSDENNKMTNQEWAYRYKTLASKVLVVAVIHKIYKEWSCFIDAVPGKRHDEEYKRVGDSGTLVNKQLARVLFPDLNSKYSWVRGW